VIRWCVRDEEARGDAAEEVDADADAAAVWAWRIEGSRERVIEVDMLGDMYVQ
jgi:hypothetical protein